MICRATGFNNRYPAIQPVDSFVQFAGYVIQLFHNLVQFLNHTGTHPAYDGCQQAEECSDESGGYGQHLGFSH